MSSAITLSTLTIASVTGADGHQLPIGTTISIIPTSVIITDSNINSNNNNNIDNNNNISNISNNNNNNNYINAISITSSNTSDNEAEMAAKMLVQQKLALTKQAAKQQQIVNRRHIATTPLPSQNIAGLSGTLSALPAVIPNYQNGTTNGTYTITTNGSKLLSDNNNNSASPDPDKILCNDEATQKRHFGWATFGKIYIPYITRSEEKYCAVRMIEMKLLNNYFSYLHPDICSCGTYVHSYFITESESRLLNEINHEHCDAQFGRDLFILKDLVVRLSDATKFYKFLDTCHRKLLSGSKSQFDRCGFIRINKKFVIPYTVRNNEQVIPLFYFEGETDILRRKADWLSGWDLVYLKFCCKVQGIRKEFFTNESVAVISLRDIKSYFPNGTAFEYYWSSKVVDSNLLIAFKNPRNSVDWTKPTGPPPKTTQAPISNIVKQQEQPVQTANIIAHQLPNKVYQNAAALQYPIPVAAEQRLNTVTASAQQSAAAAVQTQQQQNQQGYPIMQCFLVSRQQYRYAFRLQMAGITHTQQQQSPPLIRSQNQAHMSLNATTANQLQATQKQILQARQNVTAAGNTVALQQQLLAQQQQQQQQQHANASVNAIGSDSSHNQMLRIIPEIPNNTQFFYKVQKAKVCYNTIIKCIKMKMNNDTDQLTTLTAFCDNFFPNMQLDQCQRLLESLGVEMYKGNRLQTQTLIKNGKPHSENIPLILVRDVIKYMPQLRYVMRNQEQPAQKRPRIS